MERPGQRLLTATAVSVTRLRFSGVVTNERTMQKCLIPLLRWKKHVYAVHPFLLVCEMLPLYNVVAPWTFHRTDVLYHGTNTAHGAAPFPQTDCSLAHGSTLNDH